MQETTRNLLPVMVADLQEKGRSPSTVLAYRADLSQFVDFLEKKSKPLPSDILSSDIEEFRDHLLSQNYTSKSASRKLNAVKTFFRWMIDKGIVSFNPSDAVAHPKITPSIPKFLSPMEYRALRDIVRDDPRVAAITELILQTGMRISEVANLKRDNISQTSLLIEGYATQQERSIPLNRRAKEALERYLTERPQSDAPHVFISKNGKPLAVRNIRAAIDRYFQKAEIPSYSVNDLRTTFIVYNLKAGVDLVLLSQISGHKRLSTTERYLELAEIKTPGKKQVLEEL